MPLSACNVNHSCMDSVLFITLFCLFSRYNAVEIVKVVKGLILLHLDDLESLVP